MRFRAEGGDSPNDSAARRGFANSRHFESFEESGLFTMSAVPFRNDDTIQTRTFAGGRTLKTEQ
jgi:hypothetical protein